MTKISQPFILTIFGASGDLAKLKIFPSLFSLAAQGRFPENFLIVGFARSHKTEEEFQEEFAKSAQKACEKEGMKMHFCEETMKKLLSRVHYFAGQYDHLEDFERYMEFLETLGIRHKFPLPKTHICYFSVPPKVFQPILQNIALTRGDEKDDIRIVLEKPFGDDEASAEHLFHFLSRFYREEQIFLLDHYLGKTAVQSILALRHNNAILNLLLKGKEISQIQITAHETVGVEDRVSYFDEVGLIKDMFQSHLTQILAMITMSIPITADASSFHREKQAILNALAFSPRTTNIFLGQYAGYPVEGSCTETYFAAKLKIDRESWYGVPIFIRTGKKLAKKSTTVVIKFKKLPFQQEVESNHLIFELQPEEMIHIKLLNQYGQSSEFHEIATKQSISCRGDDCLPEHALLLLDVMRNEKLHFLSFPEILASWKLTDSILEFIKKENIHPEVLYPQGSDTPDGSDHIFRKEGETWFEV